MKTSKRLACLLPSLVLAFSLSACTKVPASRVVSYTPFQMANAGEAARVQKDYDDLLEAGSPTDETRILFKTFPPGVELFQGNVRIGDTSPVELIGSFEITFRSSQDEVSLVPYMKKMARAAHADILSVDPKTEPGSPEKIIGVTGHAFRRKSGKI